MEEKRCGARWCDILKDRNWRAHTINKMEGELTLHTTRMNEQRSRENARKRGGEGRVTVGGNKLVGDKS